MWYSDTWKAYIVGDITKIHSDGSVDIRTDNSKNVPSHELTSTLMPAHHHASSYMQGQTVQVYSRSRHHWCPGTVTAIHSNGSVDVATLLTKERIPSSLIKEC